MNGKTNARSAALYRDGVLGVALRAVGWIQAEGRLSDWGPRRGSAHSHFEAIALHEKAVAAGRSRVTFPAP